MPIWKSFQVQKMKIWWHDADHTAAMPIYGKNPSKIFFSETGKPISMKLGMKHWGLLPIIVCSDNDPGVTFTYFTARYVSIEGQGHFLTLAQGRVHTKIQTGFSQKLLFRYEPNFVWKLSGTRKWKSEDMMLVTWPRWQPCPYMVKNPSEIFSRTGRPISTKLGM